MLATVQQKILFPTIFIFTVFSNLIVFIVQQTFVNFEVLVAKFILFLIKI